MGNICRSPTAEAVFRHHVFAAGLDKVVRVDSAGTSGGHRGDPPDPRAVRAGARRQYDLTKLRARKVTSEDFEAFDLVLAMDRRNLDALQSLRPENHQGHLGLLLDFAPHQTIREVPDPYYGGPDGFEHVLDLAESAMSGLLNEVRARLAA